MASNQAILLPKRLPEMVIQILKHIFAEEPLLLQVFKSFSLLTHPYFMHPARIALVLCSECSYFLLLIPVYVYCGIAETQKEKIA